MTDRPTTSQSIHVFNQKNPQPYIAAFHLGPRAGKAAVATAHSPGRLATARGDRAV